MISPVLENQRFECPYCKAELSGIEEEIFFNCAYCGSALYLDRGGAILHYYLVNTMSMETAERTLRAWMDQDEMVEDLETQARVRHRAFRYFPLWYFKAQAGDEEFIYVEPAAWSHIPFTRQLVLSPGEFHFYDTRAVSDMVPPDRTCAQAMIALSVRKPDRVLEAALVHIPLYLFQYEYKGKAYLAAVEGAYGSVRADGYPGRPHAPYRTLAIVAMGIVFIEAFLAYLVWFLSNKIEAFVIVRCLLPLATAIVLFGLALQLMRQPPEEEA